jgi:predicted DNA-binding protein with PD1-like motif
LQGVPQPMRSVAAAIRHFYAPFALVSLLLPACAPARSPATQPVVRWLDPSETGPHGQAPGAKSRLVGTQADGTRSFVLILAQGDEALTGLSDFARDQKVVDAHFVAIGAVSDPEVGWFDVARKQYKAMTLAEQMEVLTLAGDVALGDDGQPVVHAHLVLARSDGEAWGGHLLRATVSPTLEVFVTAYPAGLHKRSEAATGLQLIDPTIAP